MPNEYGCIVESDEHDESVHPHEQLPPPQVLIIDKEEMQEETATAELLCHHHKMGYILFHKVQGMARDFPTHLAKCPIPVCSTCQCTWATQRQW